MLGGDLDLQNKEESKFAGQFRKRRSFSLHRPQNELGSYPTSFHRHLSLLGDEYLTEVTERVPQTGFKVDQQLLR